MQQGSRKANPCHCASSSAGFRVKHVCETYHVGVHEREHGDICQAGTSGASNEDSPVGEERVEGRQARQRRLTTTIAAAAAAGGRGGSVIRVCGRIRQLVQAFCRTLHPTKNLQVCQNKNKRIAIVNKCMAYPACNLQIPTGVRDELKVRAHSVAAFLTRSLLSFECCGNLE